MVEIIQSEVIFLSYVFVFPTRVGLLACFTLIFEELVPCCRKDLGLTGRGAALSSVMCFVYFIRIELLLQ